MDWAKIKTEYVTSDISQRALAEKYKISYATIRRRAEKGQWTSKKKEYERKHDERVAQKSLERQSDAEAEVAARKARIRVMIFEKLEEGMKNANPESAAFRRLTQSYKDMLDLEASTSSMSDGMLEDLIKGLQQ